MNVYAFSVIIILSFLVILLAGKVLVLKKSVRETEMQVREKVKDETNTLISVSSSDKDMRSLASALNETLTETNSLRHKYYRGDEEVKKAITNISHDLRTPLTAISGYLDLLKKEEKSESAERYLKIIGNRTEAMKSLTGELFKYSVVSFVESEPELNETDICSVIEESLAANYTLLTESGIEPCVSLCEDFVRMTDRNLLLRVFGNIISNAAKYSDGDLYIAADGEEVKFTNTAKELSGVQTARLFDRLYTVNDARKSTGLGLSIAKEIMKKLGGEIGAEYEENRLTVYVKL